MASAAPTPDLANRISASLFARQERGTSSFSSYTGTLVSSARSLRRSMRRFLCFSARRVTRATPKIPTAAVAMDACSREGDLISQKQQPWVVSTPGLFNLLHLSLRGSVSQVSFIYAALSGA